MNLRAANGTTAKINRIAIYRSLDPISTLAIIFVAANGSNIIHWILRQGENIHGKQ